MGTFPLREVQHRAWTTPEAVILHALRMGQVEEARSRLAGLTAAEVLELKRCCVQLDDLCDEAYDRIPASQLDEPPAYVRCGE